MAQILIIILLHTDSWWGIVMRTKCVSAAIVIAIGLAINASAQADVLHFSYLDEIHSASGTLTIGSASSGLNGPGYSITGITGTFDGSEITGLLGFAVCCRSPANNNIFYLSGPFLDLAGVGFAVDSKNVNLFFEDSYLALVSIDSNVTSELSGPGTFTVTPITQTPLPAALPLFASGLSALGLLGWWRKRKNVPFHRRSG
jgi:hypothetical protein